MWLVRHLHWHRTNLTLRKEDHCDAISHTNHNHPLFIDDSQEVFVDLTSSLQGTQCISVLKSYARNKDGRGEHQAIKSQCAGKEVWFGEIKEVANMTLEHLWKGIQTLPLNAML